MNVEVHKCDDAEVANYMQWDYFAAAAVAPAKLYSEAGPLLAPKIQQVRQQQPFTRPTVQEFLMGSKT